MTLPLTAHRTHSPIRGRRTRLLFILWVLLLVVISMSPIGVKQRLHTTGHLHYFGHFFVFALTAAAVLPGTPPLRAQILRSGMIVFLGVALEAGEAIAHHDRFEKRDLVVNLTGIAAGFVVRTRLSPKTLQRSELPG